MKIKSSKNYCEKNTFESGSVFFYILLGVVLFAALAFTISRGIRSQSTDTLSERQLDIAVSEILEKSQALARAVDRVRQNNISENDLCFSANGISTVNNTAYATVAGCGDDEGKIYHPSGGNLSFTPVPLEWLDAAHSAHQGYGEWMFTNENSVIGLGVNALNLASSAELIAHINHIKQPLCAAINKKLGISGIPNNAGAFDPTAPVSGGFSYSGEVNAAALSGKKSGCFQNTASWNTYIFYAVLLERD